MLGADSISYERWRRKYGTTKQQLEEQRGVHFSYEPKVSILVPLYRTPEKIFKGDGIFRKESDLWKVGAGALRRKRRAFSSYASP